MSCLSECVLRSRLAIYLDTRRVKREPPAASCTSEMTTLYLRRNRTPVRSLSQSWDGRSDVNLLVGARPEMGVAILSASPCSIHRILFAGYKHGVGLDAGNPHALTAWRSIRWQSCVVQAVYSSRIMVRLQHSVLRCRVYRRRAYLGVVSATCSCWLFVSCIQIDPTVQMPSRLFSR